MVSQLTTPTAYDIKFEGVEISSERLDQTYDIVSNVTEINIFEHIDRSYLTASMVVSDSSDIMTKVGFRGTERVLLRLRIKGDDRSQIVEKTFIVTDLGTVAPANDFTEGMTVNMIEEHAYVSGLTTVSRAYSGKPEAILSTMLFETLGKRIDVPKNFTSSATPPLKVVVPSMTPIKAARWIRNRAVTENGSPFYLYSTLNGPNLFLKSLDDMLTDVPVNLQRPYVFGQAFTQSATSSSVDNQARVIESYKMQRVENMFGLAGNGVVAAKHEYIDTLQNQEKSDSRVEVTMSDIINTLKDRGVLSREQSQPIFDDKFTIMNKKLSEYNTSPRYQIVTSNSFENFANYYESESADQQRLRAYSEALRHYLLKSPMQISMPGFDFLGRGPDITIGRQIRLNFLKNDPEVRAKGESILDPKRSGDYIVYTMRHLMKPDRYSVSMSCVKLGEKKNA